MEGNLCVQNKVVFVVIIHVSCENTKNEVTRINFLAIFAILHMTVTSKQTEIKQVITLCTKMTSEYKEINQILTYMKMTSR